MTYSCEVQASSAGDGADQEDKVIAFRILELVYHLLPPGTVNFTSQEVVVKSRNCRQHYKADKRHQRGDLQLAVMNSSIILSSRTVLEKIRTTNCQRVVSSQTES
jgi:hypothetical protein